MAIAITCECGKRIRAKDEHAGRRGICPSCRRELVIKTPAIAEAAIADALAPLPETLKTKPRWWRDPIIVTGATIPTLILLGFIGYVTWPHLRWSDPKHDPLAGGRDARDSRDVAEVLTRDQAGPAIPIDVSYPIMNDERNSPAQRVVTIALNHRVSEDVLREIAFKVKAAEIEQYERTHVYFVLAPYWPEKVSWAHVAFLEQVETSIAGLTQEQERFLGEQRVELPDGSRRIGSWISKEFPWRFTIYERQGRYYMERLRVSSDLNRLRTAAPNVDELHKSESGDGTKFVTDSSIYVYRMDRSGYFFVYDHDRMLAASEPVK